MAILRLQHVGMAVRDLKAACDMFEQLFGLSARDYRNDQGRGMQLDSRILLGNQVWLHLVQNWNPEARVNQFLTKHGPGLEHVSLETDSIEADVQHLRDLGVPIYMDKIFNAPDGFEAFIYPDQTLCTTVELIQPHTTSWGYPDVAGPVSSKLGITALQHVGIAVRDAQAVRERWAQLFGLQSAESENANEVRIPLGNSCWLQMIQDENAASPTAQFLAKHGAGLEHIALTTHTLDSDVQHLRAAGARVSSPALLEQGNGLETRIRESDALGMAVELVQQ